MLDITNKNGDHVDFVTGDNILDMKTFQEKNPQDEIIEKIELLWDKDYISFDQATNHYSTAMAWEKGSHFFGECPVEDGVPFKEFPKWCSWSAITLYDNDNAISESYEKYEHLYTDKYFKNYMEGLVELLGFDNLEDFLENIDVLQLFLSPSAPQYKERDRYDKQCEHLSVQIEEDFTPREIGRTVESSRWKFWTPHHYRKYLIQWSRETNGSPFQYHHDPYNFMWLKLSKTKRLLTRNIERRDVPIRSNSVIGMDGFMHSPDPTSWGISMRLSFLDSFWETKNHKSEICNNLVNHAQSYNYIPIFPSPDGSRKLIDEETGEEIHTWGKELPEKGREVYKGELSFIDYRFIDDNEEWLKNKEFNMNNWQDYHWWDTEHGKSVIDRAKKWLKDKRYRE